MPFPQGVDIGADIARSAGRRLQALAWRWRGWRLDPRQAAGLLLLVLLWLGSVVPAARDAADVVRTRTTAGRIGSAVDAAVLELQGERRLSVGTAAGIDAGELGAQRARTDQARQALDAARQGWRGSMITAEAARSADALRQLLGSLDELRRQVDGGLSSRDDVRADYTRIISAGLGAPWLPSGHGRAALGRAREALAEEDALLRGAIGTSTGVTPGERVLLAELIGARRARLADAASAIADDPAHVRLVSVEALLLLRPATAVTAADWAAAADPVDTELRSAEAAATRRITAVVTSTRAAVGYAVLVALLGFAALIGVLLLARPRPARATDGPADRELLLELHRRSQRLVHGQLRLLDAMERREPDEETLGDLFRADHLAVRLRRNAEKAISLTGGLPGRRWRRPVPLVEVVRGAAAEVDDYVRVSTALVEPAGLAGGAVTDLSHLLAELIDNATTYSPPATRVRVGGARNPDGGYTVTITDVGPGLSHGGLAGAARVMAGAEPPDRGGWGFYTVGRLAARQDITVRLAPGPAGGLIAAVTLPASLLTDPKGGPGPDAPPLSRVARMRARLGDMNDAAPAGVDSPKAGSRRIQSGQTEAQ